MKEDDLKDIAIDMGDDLEGQPAAPAPMNQAPVNPVQTAQPDVTVPRVEAAPTLQPKKNHMIFGALVAVLLLLGGAFFIWKDQIVGLFVKQPASQSQATTNTTPSSVATSALEQQKKTDAELQAFISPKTGETWLPTPKDMAPQGWLRVELLSSYTDTGKGTSYFKSAADQLKEATPTYKEVGARAGNVIILVISPSEGMSGQYYLFEKHTDGKVSLMMQPQAAGTNRESFASMKTSVTSKVAAFDQTTHYDSLNVPAKVALGNNEFAERPAYLWIVDGMAQGAVSENGTTDTLIATLGGSKLHKVEKKYTDTGLTNIGYYMLLPLGTKIGLLYAPNQTSLKGYTFDNNVNLQVKNSGTMVYDDIMAIARGCGGVSASVTRSDTLKEADLVQVGKTNAGAAVYEMKDKTSALYKKAYDEYKQSYSPGPVASFDEYVKNHGLMIIKNAKGELLVYVRGQYAPSMGCAKPVVYLYPTKTTLVDVKVGAQVTVSDPFYTVGGWKNVLAEPSGKLTYQGRQYGSLFWEGQGIGMYPGIVSGTVVKRSDAAATMRKQLVEQGLNGTEVNDFMSFWESKIPAKPYIRLTWLSTRQMDALAPLTVSPKPDTTVRVFLDMDGYDVPLSLPAQKLTKVARNGFTVVEWGGLVNGVLR